MLCSPNPGSDLQSHHPGGTPAHFVHHSWGTEKGLPQSSVSGIAQTKDGYLWLATFAGLARFDGVNFTVFDTSNTPELKSGRLRALYADSRGNLWVGSEHGGLAEYDGVTFHLYSQTDGLPSNIVTSLAGDGHGGVLVGTTEGPARLVGSRFVRLETNPTVARDTIYSLCVERAGSLWLGTESSGLIQIRGNSVQHFNSVKGLPLGRVWALAEDQQGALWIGCDRGLLRVRDNVFSIITDEHGTNPGPVVSLYAGRSGVLWVGARSGIYRLVDGSLTLFDKVATGGDSLIRTLFVDREGSLWAGTDEGLQQWRLTNIVSYDAAQGLTDHPTASLYRDRLDNVWIGSLGGGLFRYRNGRFTHFPATPEIDSPASIAEDQSGNLWLGDWNRGLLRLRANQIAQVPVPGLDAKVIRSEYVDGNGALWIGTDHRGLYKVQNGIFTHYRKSDGLLSDTVVYIRQDRAGALWLVCPEGISRFDGLHFANYSSPDILLARTLQQDPTGSLWVGTYGYGLFRFRNGNFRRITVGNGLPEAVVSSILPDTHGYFWMSGNRGIHRCSWRQLNDFADGKRTSIDCVSFGADDGLATTEANGVGEPAGIEAPDGTFWFTMVRGVAAVRPSQLPATVPPVVIEQVLIDGKLLDPKSPVRLQPGQTGLQIAYSALTFLRPDQVQFKYKLDGVDRQWIDAGNRRTVVYQGLAPGSYRFRVIADNGFGVWNSTGAALAFRVMAPFWRTTGFAALSLLFVIAAAAFLHQLRLGRLKRAHAVQQRFSRLLIESQESERQRIASELHDGLGQNLLVIKNRAFLAGKSLENPQIAGEQLAEISGTAADAIEEVRTIAFNLHPYRLDRFGLTKSIVGMCVQAAESSAIQFDIEVDPIDGLFSKESERSIFRIVQEGINNIIKHSKTAKATISVKRQKQEVCIAIKDQGQGFASLQAAGTSFGLIGMAERVRMLGGSYSLTSSPGQGTAILIRLNVPV